MPLAVTSCYLLSRPMETSGSAFGFAKGKPTERWRRKVSGLRSLELYDSGTAVIQSFHRTVSARVVRVTATVGGGQVMVAYDSNAVSGHSCGASRGCARSAAAASRAGCTDNRRTAEARTLRAW